jgi:hypothetical protein
MKRIAIVSAIFCGLVLACAPAVRRATAAPSAAQPAEFWIDPGSQPRNLFDGPPADVPRPATDSRFEILEKDPRGFSITYRVRDDAQRVWNVKIGPEAQTEVVTSRIVWAVGYHQLPSSFVERWIGVEKSKGSGTPKGALLGGARFRPKELDGLKKLDIWSWHENPFVGTRPYNGLLALMTILNSTDLKDDNNELYEVEGPPRERASRWYVVKDLGASLGETGRMDPRRGNIESFEREPFIQGVHSGRVQFAFRGRHQELLAAIGPDDVRWICERLNRITDRQWRDAFKAGNFAEDVTARYVARIRKKIDEGLQLR